VQVSEGLKMSTINSRIISILVLTPALTTLAVSPWTNFDPINLIKMLIVTTSAFGILGIVLGDFQNSRKKFSSQSEKIVLIFPLLALVPLFFSATPLNQQIWGVFGRSTGYLSYFSLWIFLVSSTIVPRKFYLNKFVTSLSFTSLLVGLYCSIQILGLDPIKWSSFAPFGTLGNVNFLSAFLGLSIVLIGVHSFSIKNVRRKTFIWFTLIAQFFIIVKTGSVQGLFMVAAGYGTFALALLYFKKGFKFFLISFIALAPVVAIFALGLFRVGPLGGILYQPSNIYRMDYWNAALKIIVRFPFTGAGFDGYDDWYTYFRGFISAYRTSPSRTSNSAHNIFLDIGVNGGLPLLICYLAIVILAFVRSMQTLRFLRTAREPGYIFIACFSSWISYQIQSLISINQIGVGIWGWILTGILIQRGNLQDNEVMIAKTGRRKYHDSLSGSSFMPAQSAVLGILLTFCGFVLAFLPFQADTEYRNGERQGNLNELLASAKHPASNAFIMAKVISLALTNNYRDPAMELSQLMSEKYPRNAYSWRVRSGMVELSESQRYLARTKAKELDPYFACLDENPTGEILTWLRMLPQQEQRELFEWWSIPDTSLSGGQSREALNNKIQSFCQ
jgi:O-antigen ligase